MKLYSYFRSSAAYRVRIALNLKGIGYQPRFVNLRSGEQQRREYLALNPQGFVPALEDGGQVLTQSLAIIEYLDEVYPNPPLLPASPGARAWVRAVAQVIACDMHPLNNVRVLNYLSDVLEVGEERRRQWYRHWIAQGFTALEKMLADHREAARFCHGDAPTLADICLVPQVVNARRYECDLAPYPRIGRIFAVCDALPAFRTAAPENQPDAD